jgi:hypothetical protein
MKRNSMYSTEEATDGSGFLQEVKKVKVKGKVVPVL